MPFIKHIGPSPSERALFELWDTVDAVRLRSGEREATKVATYALNAVKTADQVMERTTAPGNRPAEGHQ
jgi:hypothetical protein